MVPPLDRDYCKITGFVVTVLWGGSRLATWHFHTSLEFAKLGIQYMYWIGNEFHAAPLVVSG